MERDVSVASARQVVTALRSRGHEVTAVDADRGVLDAAEEAAILGRAIDRLPPEIVQSAALPGVAAALAELDFDVVFLAVHGGVGENGTLQSLLDLHGIRYTGSGPLGSALAWDKRISKQLFTLAQVPTPAWRVAPSSVEAIERDLGFPVIVKPSGQGSTVGLTRVDEPGELDAAIGHARRFDRDVLIERYIPGRELTVGVLGDQPLAVGEIIPAEGDIFDYAAKYQPGGAEEVFPADVDETIARQAQMLALVAHNAVRCSHYSRVDFRLDDNGSLWCLEVNTLPGLSSGSLLPQSAAAAGIDFAELCDRIVRSALQ